MKWEIAKTEDSSPEMFDLLADGWEPFSITPMMKVSPFNPQQGVPVVVVWLKRLAKIDSSKNPEPIFEDGLRDTPKPSILRSI